MTPTPSDMGKASRDKGKRFEREIASVFRERFGHSYRGAPLQASGGCIMPDVVTPLPIHIECSHGKAVSAHGKLEQAIRDARAGMVPIAITRRDRGETIASLRLEDLLDILEEWQCGSS